MFVPLHVKSDYSAGYGTTTVDELVRCAAGHGFAALALTDVENLCGQVQLHRAARAAGLRPITGIELRAGHGPRAVGARAGRLVLLARDREGYQSLCRIVSVRRRDPDRPSPPPIACLQASPRGVLFLSDDPAAIRALLRAGVPARDVRRLLVRPVPVGGPPPEDVAGVRVVADTDVVMAHPADRDLHVLRLAIRRRCRVEEVGDADSAERSFAGLDELRARFADVPGALEESRQIAAACALELGAGASEPSPTLPAPTLPSIELPPGDTPDGALEAACRARLAAGRRAGLWTAAGYDARLRDELAVIERLGLAGYFLIVGEIAGHARERGIHAVARGSAVGSLVCHVLGVSAVDPVRHGLYFERFLHEGKRELPDVDLDLPSDRRDEVIAWVFARFGPGRVAMASAHQRFQRRAALREGLKAHGMSPTEVDRLCGRLPSPDLDAEPPDVATPASASGGAAHNGRWTGLPLALLGERARRALPVIERLIGTFQHLSVHPGGVVIASPRVDLHAPLERAPKGVPVTQYDMRSLADLGLIKIDLLGNRALAAIQATCQLAGIAPPSPERDDPATLQALREARTIGCFQVETPAVRSVLRRLPLRDMDDLAAALAAVRPGPASGEAKAAYIRRAHGEDPPIPPHPRLAAALAGTHGMLLYEEDLMAAISLMTGWPVDRADDVRAALVREGGDAAAVAALERSFVEAAGATGVKPSEAAGVWGELRRFAAYSFSKAHAISYARLAWQSAFLKTHRPVEFACAVLDRYGGHYPLRTVAAECSRAGVRLWPPHVNASDLGSRVDSGAVRLGLGAVRRLTARARRALLAARPFRDVGDLLARVTLSAPERAALFLSGACDDLAPLAAAAYPFAHEDLLARLREMPAARALAGFAPRHARGARLATYQALVRARNELTYLQMHPSAHPMAVLRDEAARVGCRRVADLPAPGQPVKVAGLIAATRRLPTAAGPMQFVTLEDESGLVEVVLFPGTYAALQDPVTAPGPFLITARVTEDHGDRHLIASTILPFHSRGGVRS